MTVGRLTRPLAILEAGYSLRGSASEWLTDLTRAVAHDFDQGLGVMGMVLELRPTRFVPLVPMVTLRLPDHLRPIVARMNDDVPGHVSATLRRRALVVGSATQALDPLLDVAFARDGLPFRDLLGLAVQDGEGNSLQFSAPMPRKGRMHDSSVAAWRKVGLHLGTAWRLRTRLASGSEPEAIFERGKLVHAEGPAQTKSARAALVQAVHHLERVRSGGSKGSDVLDLWRGLVAGRWSVVDRWDSRGHRYLAAFENIARPSASTTTPSKAVAMLSSFLAGVSASELAWAFGVAPATVQRILSDAARRLGMRSRADLLRLAEPSRMTRIDVPIGHDSLAVLRLDRLELPPALARRLSRSEREVVERALAGASDGEIAAARSCSIRTVNNLLGAAYSKLGVSGRQPLVRLLAHEHSPQEASSRSARRRTV